MNKEYSKLDSNTKFTSVSGDPHSLNLENNFNEGLVPTIDEDILVGYIMRTCKEKKGINLMYEDVRAILDAELEYLTSLGIAEEE